MVELTGHTANNSLRMMTCRPAPVQAKWTGYPNITGLPTIDYRFTDSLDDPPNSKQKHVEELISLDTFPYAGTTTTCESLYMGVPCVAMAGSVHAHNVGVSLLHQVGLERLIAQNEDEYINKALELASDIS
ncbi:hypothetical protein SUGI_0410680 [Cryptomeria japonica]|nr:hypothetical protein SUGI_0410680 [Cryptomeria japonica]